MDTRTLDLQSLRIFKAVVEEAGVTRAAERLHYVQSNVTMRLKQLEAELGVALFHRVAGRLVITPAGRRLSEYADRLLRLAQEARRSVVADDAPSGPLAIGAMETTAATRLPHVLAGFVQRHPEVDLTLETGPTAHLVQRVVEFALDAALVGGAVEHPALASKPVFEEELLLITRRGHAPVRVPADLGAVSVLAFRSGCSYRRRLEAWLESAGVVPQRTFEFGTVEGIVACVAAGMGVAAVTRAFVEQRGLHDAVDLHPLPRRFGRITTMLVWHRAAGASAARDAFAAALEEA